MTDMLPELIIPAGTQVVTRAEIRDAGGRIIRPRGAVGIIVALPVDAQHAYRVRFADGGEAALRRGELSIRKEYQRDGLLPDRAATGEPGYSLTILNSTRRLAVLPFAVLLSSSGLVSP